MEHALTLAHTAHREAEQRVCDTLKATAHARAALKEAVADEIDARSNLHYKRQAFDAARLAWEERAAASI